MQRKFRRILAVFLCATLLSAQAGLQFAQAAVMETVTIQTENEEIDGQEEISDFDEKSVSGQEVQNGSEGVRKIEKLVVNPLYRGIIDEAELACEIEAVRGSEGGQDHASDVHGTAKEAAYSTVTDAASYLRGQMVAREETVTIPVSDSLFSQEAMEAIFDEASAHTEDCSGEEGDALRWVYSGYRVEGTGNGAAFSFVYTISYYTTYEQETELTTAVNNSMADMQLEGKSEYQKVQIIHDYICDHVDYDYAHLNDETYKLQFTAYAALCQGKSVCQGYAVLFYRMCKEAGLSVRVIAGTGNGGRHAWNIVKVDDYYYNIDCTWDGQDSATKQDWLLLSEDDFTNHFRDEEYASSEFYRQYPMAPVSCRDYIIKFPEALKLENLIAEYITTEDEKVSSRADDRPKLLIFFHSEEADSQSLIQDISKNISDFAGADIYAVEIGHGSKDAVISFGLQYGCEEILFSYDEGNTNSDSMDSYVSAGGFDNPVSAPVICFIDAENRLQRVIVSSVSAESLLENLVHYCKYSGQAPEDKPDTVINQYSDDHSAWIPNYPADGYVYTGKAQRPGVVVLDSLGNELLLSRDYTVKYTKNTNAGQAKITIKGKGKKKSEVGTKTIPFTVRPAELDETFERLPIKAKVYNAKKQEPSVKVRMIMANGKKKTLKARKDYLLSYEQNVESGTATVTIAGTGNFTGSITTTFIINKKPVNKGVKVSKIPPQTGDGSAKCPKPVVKFGKVTLEEGTDYTLSYQDNTEKGKAQLIITGTGNFSGTLRKYFKII